MEVIPVPDSLGEEAILIDIFTGRGYLKQTLFLVRTEKFRVSGQDVVFDSVITLSLSVRKYVL